jgi:hypothetical protein
VTGAVVAARRLLSNGSIPNDPQSRRAAAISLACLGFGFYDVEDDVSILAKATP